MSDHEDRTCENCGRRVVRATYCGHCRLILCRTCAESPAHATYDQEVALTGGQRPPRGPGDTLDESPC